MPWLIMSTHQSHNLQRQRKEKEDKDDKQANLPSKHTVNSHSFAHLDALHLCSVCQLAKPIYFR